MCKRVFEVQKAMTNGFDVTSKPFVYLFGITFLRTSFHC